MKKDALYENVARQIIDYIHGNKLLPDSKLPGGSKLASIFKVSKNVIFQALDYLVSEGFIEVRQSSGSYVTRNIWYSENYQPDWEHFMNYKHNPPASHMLQKTRANSDGSLLHLSIMMTDSSFGYNKALINSINDSICDINDSNRLITYSAHGSIYTREAVRNYLAHKNIHVPNEQVIIAANHDIALDTVMRALLDGHHRGIIYAENYQVELLKVILNGSLADKVQLKSLECDQSGPSPQGLKSILGGDTNTRRVILLTPNRSMHNSPKSISNSRRKKIYNICSEAKLPIVEYDRLSDLSPMLRPLKAIDSNDCVIYINSLCFYSQLGIGTAWIVAPAYIVPKILDVSISPSVDQFTFNQIIIEKMLSNGHYQKFIHDLPAKIKTRAVLTNKLLDKYLYDIATWNRDMEYGMCWLRMDGTINVHEMLAVEEKKIMFIPCSCFDPKDTSHIYLSPCCVTEEELIYGIQMLSELARKCKN